MLAWAGAFVLTSFVLLLNILVRLLARKGRHS
jgi:ABC-type phosphate transport system permease subunit